MSELIYVDGEGNELRRETKRQGRPPRGSVKQENGDFIVSPVTEKDVRFVPQYITVDKDNNEVVADLVDNEGTLVSRRNKGRGRAKPGYVKQICGDLEGHWVKIINPETIEETPEVTEVVETAEAVIVTETEEGVTT